MPSRPPATAAPPTILRSCGACDVVDDLRRVTHDIGDGRVVYFHDPADGVCGQPGADPHPELDEDAITSQYRSVLEAAGVPDIPDTLNVFSVDASDPANHHTAPGPDTHSDGTPVDIVEVTDHLSDQTTEA